MRVAVLGAGSWGTTVAAFAAKNADAMLWARDPALAAQIRDTRENAKYLAGISLPPNLGVTSDLGEAVADADVLVIGVPSHGFRDVLTDAKPLLSAGIPVVSLSKGIEQGTSLRMTQVVLEVLGDHSPSVVGVLTGPNLAREMASGQPGASVIAMADSEVAAMLQKVFTTESFRVYTNPDVVGCEIAGAAKNIIAIAAGAANGLAMGDSSMAALVTRGLAEMARLGIALGGEPLTFAGLAGLGDLVATCTSPLSRNRTVGVQLGQGRPLQEILDDMHMVAEGVKSTAAFLGIAKEAGVEMPIAEQVAAVLYEGRKPAELVNVLMGRSAKPELQGISN